MDKLTKPDKKRRKSMAKEIRASAIVAKSLAGDTATEIANDMGLARQTVSKILNSEEVKAKIKVLDAQLANLIDPSLETIKMAVEARYTDLAVAYKAARDVLKNFGSMKESVDVNHQFPKPLVIESHDGKQVILGTTADLKEET